MNPITLSALGDLSIVFLTVVVIPTLLWLLRLTWKVANNDLPHIYRVLQRLADKTDVDISDID